MDAIQEGQNWLDQQMMRIALAEAERALDAEDVPVGAVVVREGRVIGRGCNQREALQDPTAHAEMIALTAAAAEVRSWRLEGCTLYVTLEPCTMCAGAIVLARIDRLVFGADDPKAGACGSVYNIIEDGRLNHRPQMTTGVLAAECGDLLRAFFAEQRARGKK
ncbi:MAG: tRNA adenosine(34) deaminase TadA [Phycisphaerae bacterium]|jgi:tRNA(adenine34) deaminase|nr:tRNA adenosine(34) deaminase TadA [Phycisphaerae bacterium]